jgi:hypothetical protein
MLTLICFQQIKQREHTEKVNLLLSCGQYKLWPRQPLLQVAELIEWISYPPNTGKYHNNNNRKELCIQRRIKLKLRKEPNNH